MIRFRAAISFLATIAEVVLVVCSPYKPPVNRQITQSQPWEGSETATKSCDGITKSPSASPVRR